MAALWIGGPPGAGKTTVALRIARRHGLRWYGADTRTWEHRDRAVAAGVPAAVRWEALTPERRWAAPPAELLAMSLHRERAAMVRDDVRALPARPLTVAEGTPVVPPTVDGPAVWLLPTPAVQRQRLAGRGLRPGALVLYRTLAEEIADAAAGRPVVEVGPGLGTDDVVAAVEAVFADALQAGPVAASAGQRRELLRAANRAVVAQYRAAAARPGGPPGAADAVVALVCECGAAGCLAEVARPVSAAGPVLAPGHRAE